MICAIRAERVLPIEGVGVGRELGIIGFGNFGTFMARHLSGHFDLDVCDQRDVEMAARRLGCRPVSVEAAARARRVVLAVPVAALRSVLEQIRASLEPGTLVIDVASVKLKPLELMAELLPPHVDFVGTHPLFGPQSGAEGIHGLRIALCPGRIAPERLARLRSFLADTLGLEVHEVTPEDHDHQMAFVQGLTHLMGWAFKGLDPPDSPLSTLAYDRMLSLERNVKDDSIELFHTIQRENPFAREVRHRLIDEIRRLNEEIESS
jgi:prephenate dehydrogenase